MGNFTDAAMTFTTIMAAGANTDIRGGTIPDAISTAAQLTRTSGWMIVIMSWPIVDTSTTDYGSGVILPTNAEAGDIIMLISAAGQEQNQNPTIYTPSGYSGSVAGPFGGVGMQMLILDNNSTWHVVATGGP